MDCSFPYMDDTEVGGGVEEKYFFPSPTRLELKSTQSRPRALYALVVSGCGWRFENDLLKILGVLVDRILLIYY